MSPPTPKPDDDNSKKPTTDKRSKYIYHNKSYDTFALSVKGKTIYGLIVDPGAARGLIGADTLKDIIQHVLKPHGKHRDIKWHRPSGKFQGISAEPQQSLGQCEFPIGLLGIQGTFTADVIGGKGSMCPGLLPCKALMNNGCLISFGYFPNGDGLMGIRAPNGTLKCQRLLYTDSGHNVLPIHNFDTKADNDLNTLIMHESQFLTKNTKIPRALQDTEKPTKTSTKNTAFPVGLVTDDSNDHAEENEMTAPPGLALITSPPQPFH